MSEHTAEIDAAVQALVLRHAREEYGNCPAACPELVVSAPNASDGFYGCDTGCHYLRLTAGPVVPARGP